MGEETFSLPRHLLCTSRASRPAGAVKIDPEQCLRTLPAHRIGRSHLAGHGHTGIHLLDTHDGAEIEPVWGLSGLTARLFDHASTLSGWDGKEPGFAAIGVRVERARVMEAEGKGVVYAVAA